MPGVASAAGVPVDKAASAIEKFLQPDEWSRSKEFEGRRIEVADRGWNILNYERFRDMRDEEARKEYERQRKRKQRAGQAGTDRDIPGQTVKNDDCPAVSAHAEASASAQATPEPEEKKKEPRKRVFLVEVEKPADVMVEVWEAWLAVRKRKSAPLTEIAWTGVLRETAKAGWHINEVVRKMAERNWQSVEAAWLAKEQSATKVTANGRPVVEASTMHIPNMPLGHESCNCAGCAAAKLTRSLSDAKNVSNHTRATP